MIPGTPAVIIVVFVVGSVVGSFLNVVIHRLPRGESLVRPASHCPACGTPIRPWDNVPVVSYLLLRGRCRSCGAPIAWRYPAVEIAAGALSVAVWLRGGSWLDVIAGTLLCWMLLAIFFIDLAHHIVPDAISYPGLAAGLVLAAGQGRLIEAAAAALGAGALFFLIAVASRGGMGGGDVKLAAMMGAFLGWPAIAVALLAAFVLGAAVGVGLIATGRRSRKDLIPFGPSLAVGAAIALFLSGPIITWYLQL